MQGNFESALRFVLQMEGGYSDVPGDDGGATNMGITQGEYNTWRESHELGIQSVRDISMAEVQTIYHDNYWGAVRGDYIAGPLDLILFDTAVNNGDGRAFEFLNESLGLGRVMAWTQETSDKYHAMTADDLKACCLKILELRSDFYHEDAQRPEQGQFLRGWLNRIHALKVAAGYGDD
jgi:lysozyme family protein